MDCRRIIALLAFYPRAETANGDWRLEYPPWGETTTSGGPEIWFPLIGPFTGHGCFPARYMSQRIAVNHVNRRDSTFCPAIATLQNPFSFKYSLADSNANGIGAASAVMKFLSNTSRPVKVVLGPNSSGSSKSMSDILAVFNIPHISWAATSADLTNKASYPMFFRVVSPDSLVMKVLAGWLNSLGVTKTNIAYFDADFQSGQARDFIDPATTTHGMQVTAFQIPNSGKGGAAVTNENMVKVREAVVAIRNSGVRVVVTCVINEEAYDFYRTAYEYGIFNADGWLWFGTDGLNGGMLANDQTRLKYFAGTVFVQAFGEGPQFGAYKSKWAELMPSTSRPEFDQFDLCVNGSTTSVCQGNPGFRGMNADELVCTGYTGLAYDAVVTLAVVADKMITKGKNPDTATSSDWLDEMRLLSEPGFKFDCLTGQVSFNSNQERDMPMAFNNWHSASLSFVNVANWDGVNGYQWVNGATVYWPSGTTAVISGTPATPLSIPSGRPPTCSSGKVYNNTNLACSDCPVGKYTSDGLICIECQPGAYQDTMGKSACSSCDKGKYSTARASTQCLDCEAGKYQEVMGKQSCIACVIGYYAEAVGASACSRCPKGKYSEHLSNNVRCLDCSNSKTTANEGAISDTECACDAQSYLPWTGTGSSGTCTSCPPGMTCEFGAAASSLPWSAASTQAVAALPKVKEFHMSLSSSPLEVYKCLPPDICQGGLPGTCKGGRDPTVIACGRCPPGQVLSGTDCQECSAWENFTFFIFIAFSVCACFVGYYAVSSKLTAKLTTMLSISLIFGALLSLVQTLGIFALLSTPWPDGFRELLEAMSIFTADFDILNIGCAFGDASHVLHYAVSMLWFPFCIITLLIFSVVSKVFPQKYKWTKYNTLNVIGAFCQVCFTSMCGVGNSAFIVYEHPMGDWSVMRYPDILTSSGTYAGVVVVGVLMLILAMTYYVVCATVLVMAPAKAAAANSQFLQACRFLLIRFRVDVWYWGLINMARALLISLCPIIGTGEPRFQMLLIALILSISMLLIARYRPWRAPSLNLVDISVCFVLMLLVLTATAFIGEATGGWLDFYEALLWIETMFAFFLLAVMAGLTIQALVKNGAFGTIQDIVTCQKVPDSHALAKSIAGMSAEAAIRTEPQIAAALAEMQVFDMWALANALSIMQESSILKADKHATRRQMSVRLSNEQQ